MGMKLEIHNVTKDRWRDFEELFECKGGPHNCWCMAWRNNENKHSIPGKSGKKLSIKRRIDEGVPVGILAYNNKIPIAWCSIAPRDTYRSLGGDDSVDNVWSLTCFFVKREFRCKGISTNLLNAAIEHAGKNGAKYVEAYPVEPDSPSYRFMGFTPMFEKAGFHFVKKAGCRRSVMLYQLYK